MGDVENNVDHWASIYYWTGSNTVLLRPQEVLSGLDFGTPKASRFCVEYISVYITQNTYMIISLFLMSLSRSQRFSLSKAITIVPWDLAREYNGDCSSSVFYNRFEAQESTRSSLFVGL